MPAVRAAGTLTVTANFANTETVTVGGKVYTFQDTLTDVDGNVKVGASASASLDNLKAAINLESGAGTAYAASMTENLNVRVSSKTATTIVVKARVPGTIGNLIASTETGANASWGGAVLASGTGSVASDLHTFLAAKQLPADVAQEIRDIIDAQGSDVSA